jgi:hypothetical protein
MANKNKFKIEINTDDLEGSPEKKRPQLDTLG